MELPVSGGPTASSARRPSNTPGARAISAAPGSKGADGVAGSGSAAEAMDTSSETGSAGGGVNGGQGVCGEFEVVLKRESGEGGALGLSLAGGAQTAIRAVVVHELFGPGAAARDGRLKHGDHILEVDARLMFLLCLQRHSAPHARATPIVLTLIHTRRSTVRTCGRRRERTRWPRFDSPAERCASACCGRSVRSTEQ